MSRISYRKYFISDLYNMRRVQKLEMIDYDKRLTFALTFLARMEIDDYWIILPEYEDHGLSKWTAFVLRPGGQVANALAFWYPRLQMDIQGDTYHRPERENELLNTRGISPTNPCIIPGHEGSSPMYFPLQVAGAGETCVYSAASMFSKQRGWIC
ncbi:hypothetical protein CEXT_478501 [Caerostris extrusa]|uniref:Uncharacterized protein n=1 Tax=Caerostris extrusa TaxID=172846 RepID=A0AAV4XXV5_CAEEX|nr:hypothetical protein CEXT_478501 [Caerostris extrusa]